MSVATHGAVRSALAELQESRAPWVLDIVAACASLLVIYDPAAVAPERVVAWVQTALARDVVVAATPRRITVPVCYDPALAPDLAEVARLAGVSTEDVVRRHTAREVTVFMLGFKPGFPYMGEVDEVIQVPRLAAPRSAVPTGSVALAGRQTGIYPVTCPGGWRVIGRTPWRIFDPRRAEPFRLLPGDLVRFEAVDAAGFARLATAEAG